MSEQVEMFAPPEALPAGHWAEGLYRERTVPAEAELRPVGYEQCVKEKFSLPEGWVVYKWEAKGGERAGDYSFVIVTGAVIPLKAKAKHARDFDYKKRDKRTEFPLTLLKTDYLMWLEQWERDTGLCHECSGSGRAWSGWSAGHGTFFKPCKRCHETGNSPEDHPHTELPGAERAPGGEAGAPDGAQRAGAPADVSREG